MARKKKHPEHVNHERWLISYADFITLLFAFFVVMFAVSQVDGNKAGRFTESFQEAVGAPLLPKGGAGVLPGGNAIDNAKAQRGEPTPLDGFAEKLEKKLAKNEATSGVSVIRKRNEIVLRLPNDIVFASGDDALKEPALKVLKIVADELKANPFDIRVEGHTDDIPIHTARFRSNWELSTARATVVVAQLIETYGIEPTRLAAAGYGEFRPVADNATPAGRNQNRRVDLVVTQSAAAGATAQK